MKTYVVTFRDGIAERVEVNEDEAQSEEHLAEMIAQASSDPDDVDDWWAL